MHALLLTLALLAGDVPADSSAGKGGEAGLFPELSIDVDGTARDYRLLVPKGLKRGAATPLVFAFHGRGGDARRMASYCGLDDLAKREKFILVYSTAIAGNWKLRTAKDNEDLAFFDAVYGHLCQQYPIDRNRVFCTGMSMGGYFSNFVAAHRSDQIAAIAPHSGGLGALAVTGLKVKNKYAVLVIHGDADRIVPVSQGQASQQFYEKAGHPIEYREIEGLRHRWASKQNINTQIWEFFSAHPRNVRAAPAHLGH